MKIKARIMKMHRINFNGVLCDKSSFDKLISGDVVDVKNEVANELLKMGVVEKAIIKKVKKESDNG
tara:strand:- start:636 stop:833 length:198 start_codon:yes stop_codon:yes gene_type:complete